MKNFAFGLAILGVMALLAGNASAQATTKAGPKPVLVAKVEEMKTVLKLPDEMVDKMIDLIIKTDKAKEDLAKEFESVKAEYDKAKAANEAEGIKSATEKWTALFKRQAEVNTKGSADIDSLLTGEQVAQWREHKYLEPILASYKKADLTEDQIAKIRVEFGRFVAANKPDETSADWQFRMQLSGKLTPFIQKEILTDDQRFKMVLGPILAQYKSLDLTDAQVTKIKEQLTTLIKEAKPDDPPYTAQMKIGAYIQKEVLTDEQREKLVIGPTLEFYKRAGVTDEQLAKFKDKYRELAKEAKPDDPPQAIQMKLGSFMIKEVLTDEQRTKMGYKSPK